MKKVKRVGLTVMRALMAFMFFMNGLAAFLNGLAGKTSYEKFWLPLVVAIGGLFILHISRRTVEKN